MAHPRTGLITLALVVTLLVACTPSSESGSESEEHTRISALLERASSQAIEGEEFDIQAIDYQQIYDVLGHEMPADCSVGLGDMPDSFFEMLTEIYEPFKPMKVNLTDREMYGERADGSRPFDAAFGVDWCDVRAVLSVYGQNSQYGVDYLDVRSSPSEIETAINSEPFWKDQYVRNTRGSETIYTWRDGGIERRSPPVRLLGFGGQFTIIDEGIVSWDELAILDVDEPRPLFERDYVQSVAEQLDDKGAVAFQLVSEDRFSSANATELLQEFTPALLEPWEVLGLGATVEADGQGQLIAVLAHSTTEAAIENAELLRAILDGGRDAASGEPWSDSIVLADIQVTSNLVVATIDGVGDVRPFEVGYDALRTQSGLWYDGH